MAKKRKLKICPNCGHKFYHFKWRHGYPQYDGDIACCRKCGSPALLWDEYRKDE